MPNSNDRKIYIYTAEYTLILEMVDILKEIFKEKGIEKNLDNLIKYASLELETINRIDYPLSSKHHPGSNHYGWNLNERKIVERILEDAGIVVYFNSRMMNSDGSGHNVHCAELTEKGRELYSDLI